MMRLIGDVHGKFAAYESLIAGVNESVQIGDLGFGFHSGGNQDGSKLPEPPFEHMWQTGKHRFIRGNQDDPNLCSGHDLFIKDGTIEGDVFYCGGALSTRQTNRIEGVNWWPEEEPSEQELADIREIYLDHKPKLAITHDCPHSIAEAILKQNGANKPPLFSRTRHAFQAMWEIHKPDLWIFGHWHLSFETKISGTRFICLDQLETFDI